MMTTVETTADTASNEKARPMGQLLIGIIDKPTATFEAILSRRKWSMWAVPLMVFLFAFAVMTVVNLPYTQEMAREQAEAQLASLPAEQAEAARSTMEVTLSVPFLLATGLGMGAVILLIGIVAQATFLYFSALIAGGDDMDFGSVFTVSAWTRLPMALGFLVQAGFIAVSRGAIRYPGLAALVATGDLMQDAKNPGCRFCRRRICFGYGICS